MSQDNQAPLREDVRLLGKTLGEVVKEQAGEQYFNTVEEIRALSKAARRDNGEEAELKLKSLIRSLSDEETKVLTRCFGHFLNLANIAESYHDMRKIRNEQEEALTSQIAVVEETIKELLAQGKDKYEIFNAVSQMSIELVLTAHPTEVKRRTLIRKFSEISSLLNEREVVKLTPAQRRENEDTLKVLITGVWQTDEIRRVKPTPVEEAKWGMAIIEETLWDAVPAFLRQLDTILEHYTGKKLDPSAAPVTFASWMGGDRDGNPNVTHEVTREVVYLSRWMASDLFYKEINELIQRLSMQNCSEELRSYVGDAAEPYRAFLRTLRNRFKATKKYAEAKLNGELVKPSEDIILSTKELTDALYVCHRSLAENNGQEIANTLISDLIRRANCFGLTLTRLDIRQESTRHSDVLNRVTEYLGLGSYDSWSEEERIAFLVKECQSKRPLIPADVPFDADEQEVMDTLRTLAAQPSESFGAHAISMTSTASDVLEVALLQKEAGIATPLRISPLFETLDDLDNAALVMDALFSIPSYKASINGHHEVMIGYSDSGKDAGKLAACWAQYRAQEALYKVASKHDVKLTLFHGRGGSIGRGGGPVQHALLSQPPGTVDGRTRVTEQGEVIQQKFSIKEVAIHNMMLYVTAVLEATLNPPIAPKDEWRQIMDEMAELSCKNYRDVIRSHKDFVAYFRQVTPEQELGRLSIGSRPAKRKASGGIESLRAIPWIFAWTQTRLLLPSWLGIGAAMQQVLDKDQLPTIKEMIQDWPFFYFFLDMLDMVLVKADPRIAEYYDECLAKDELRVLGDDLRERLAHTKKVASEIIKDLNVKSEREVLRESVVVRNTYTDPLNLLQAEILRRVKVEGREIPVLEDALMMTIAGISAGMKNTG